jgi:hypothetical protein
MLACDHNRFNTTTYSLPTYSSLHRDDVERWRLCQGLNLAAAACQRLLSGILRLRTPLLHLPRLTCRDV